MRALLPLPPLLSALLLTAGMALTPPAAADGLVLIGNESSVVLQRGENLPGWDGVPPETLPVGEVVAGRLEFGPQTLRIASVTYADPESGRGCHLRIQTAPSPGACEVTVNATPRGEGDVSCSARVLEEDAATCGFTAVMGIDGF